MTTLSVPAFEIASHLARALEAANIPYAIGGAIALDAPYIRRWTVERMGEDDERVPAWDTIVAKYWK